MLSALNISTFVVSFLHQYILALPNCDRRSSCCQYSKEIGCRESCNNLSTCVRAPFASIASKLFAFKNEQFSKYTRHTRYMNGKQRKKNVYVEREKVPQLCTKERVVYQNAYVIQNTLFLLVWRSIYHLKTNGFQEWIKESNFT